jgi:hypothetical protein
MSENRRQYGLYRRDYVTRSLCILKPFLNSPKGKNKYLLLTYSSGHCSNNCFCMNKINKKKIKFRYAKHIILTRIVAVKKMNICTCRPKQKKISGSAPLIKCIFSFLGCGGAKFVVWLRWVQVRMAARTSGRGGGRGFFVQQY